MRHEFRHFKPLVLTAAILAVACISGCAAHASYRVYDPDYNDYHRWNDHEVVYYNQWEVDTHRDRREFRDRSTEEQSEYWKWRHSHHDKHDRH
ncbi:MAG: hypothetical protein WB987_13095 [Candidatus Acidiferrales bacterium]